MAAIYRSSSKFGFSASNGPSGQTYTSSKKVSTAPDSTNDEPGTAVSTVGDAIALGDNTATTASVQASVSSGSSSAHASFTAAAQGGTAYTSTYADVLPSSGGDRGFTISGTSNSTSWNDNYQASTSSSFIDYQMLDFDALRNGSARSEPAPAPSGGTFAWGDSGAGGGGSQTGWGSWNLDGNTSSFEINAAAYGDNSYVDVQVTAFTLEDMLSSVSAMVLTGIG